ncbi:MAG: spore germination protein, partial [Firmicutes bacterium]|nr:spore germination protein [Bacillota bacterium]
MKKNKDQQATIGKTNKSNISQTQFFLLFCLCFFMPATVFLPRLMSEQAGNLAWVCPLLGIVFILLLLCVFALVGRVQGDGLCEKSIKILGKPLAIALCVAMMIFCLFLASYFARHFAERVLMVYLTDTSSTTILLGLMIVVLVALGGGILSFARLCEVMFYIFISIFVLVTVAGLIDGLDSNNILGFAPGDTLGVVKGAGTMLLPFCIFVCMSFFGERVNWKKGLLKQGTKSSLLVGACTTAVVLLCVGALGVFGTQYLQMPYFALTRQIQYLG